MCISLYQSHARGLFHPWPECVDYDGTVSVYAGRGLTDVQELDGGSHLMHQQALIGSEGGTGSASPDHVCSQGPRKQTSLQKSLLPFLFLYQDCLRWQQVVLTTPQAVVTGQEYTVRISPPSRPDAVVRLGLLVADGYARGMNNFVVRFWGKRQRGSV